MTSQIQPTNPGPIARPAGIRPPVAMQASMTPKEIVGILRRHILLIVVLTLLGAACGTGGFFVLRKYYPRWTALGAIQVLEPGQTDPTELRDAQANRDVYDRFRNSKLARIRGLATMQALLRREPVRGTRWFQRFVDGQATDIPRAIRELERHLRVSAPRDDVHIMVSMTCGNPQEAALIAEELIDLFLRQQQDEATEDMRRQLNARTQQAVALKRDVDAARSRLQSIRAGTQFANLGESTFRDYLTESLAHQQTSLSQLENIIVRLESNVQILKLRAEGEYDDVVREQIERDPISQRMRDVIATLEADLREKLTRLGESHRRVREVRDALDQRRLDLAKRQAEIGDLLRNASYRDAQDQYVFHMAQLEAQRKQLQDVKAEYRDWSRIKAEYLEAITERDEKQALLEEANAVIEKLRTLSADPQVSKVKMALRPEAPLMMSSPKVLLFLPGGTMLGLLAGLAFAFALELLNDMVRTPSDVVRHVRVPLLGTICHVDEDDSVDASNLAHVVRQAPYSILSECYRQFRTNLTRSGQDQSRKVILITSGAAGDGKTTTAVNLASTLAAEQQKVLLIDANFRRPMMASLFSRPEGRADYGLSNYLMGQCDAGDGIIRTGGENIDIVDSGPLPANPGELLAGARMKELLDKARLAYDYVIIDGPPLLVSDAKNLAAEVDGTVLVVNAESTRRGAAQRAIRELREINAVLVGTVLVGARAIKGGYFHEVYRSYQEYQRVGVGQPTA